MDTRSAELARRIRLGEDSGLELKSVALRGRRVATPRREDVADELAAMANGDGGTVVFGVDDATREVRGLPLDALDPVERWLHELCHDSVEPPLQMVRISKLELEDPTGALVPLVAVTVPRSLFVHRSPGGYLRRLGSEKRVLRPELLARLFQQRSQARLIRFDEQAVPGTGPGDLDPVLASRFLPDWVREERSPGAPLDDDALGWLRKLRILTPDEDGAERLSVAGALMATRSAERWLPGATIEAVRYRGAARDANHQLDARSITGPLDQQVLEALAFVRRNMSVYAVKRPGRIDLPQYSERAIFEALVNAVAHRDYSVHGSKVRLFVFMDRLELYSPGGLPNSLTVDSMGLRQATRNELVASLLARCPLGDDAEQAGRSRFMDRRGEGVPVILRQSLRIAGREPTYLLVDDAELVLTVYAAPPPDPVE